jgi:hypothetical protein
MYYPQAVENLVENFSITFITMGKNFEHTKSTIFDCFRVSRNSGEKFWNEV